MNIVFKDWDGNVTISVIYCSQSHAIKNEQSYELIISLWHIFLVGGDLNAEHH